MKNYILKLKKAIGKLIRNQVGRVRFSEWVALIFTLGVVVGISVFIVDYNIKSDKAEKYDNTKNKYVSEINNVKTTSSMEVDDKRKALEDLEIAKKLSKKLGTIKIVETAIDVTHAVELGKEDQFKWAIIEKKATANCSSYLDALDIEWELDLNKECLIAYIDRPTIKKEDVRRDTKKMPLVLRHPIAGVTEKFSEKNELIKFWKTSIDNDNKKGLVTLEQVVNLDMKWDNTFDEVAYKQAKKELLSNDEYMKKLDECAINVVSNVYNPNISTKVVYNNSGTVTKVNLPNKTRVDVRFKDQREA